MTGICAGAAAGLAGFTPWAGAAQSQRPLKGYIRTNWSKDPLAYGGYSYVAKGASRRDTRELRRPVSDRLFFAGEAANPVHNSTVHAAHQSGLLAAEAVLATQARRIAIVGAGMAGLTAAFQLSLSGQEVTVYEARDRIGGRVWTSERLGVPLDLGASWIHSPIGNPLTALADQAGQERVETDDSGVGRGGDGRLIEYNDLPSWVLNEIETQTSAGAEAGQINELAYWRGDGFSGNDVVFPGGYADIFTVLKGDYAIELSSRVTDVQWGEKGASLSFASDRASDFDAVIITVPLGVLKRDGIRFDPPLPERKQRAIERLGMGLLDKVYLLFEEPFWDDVTWIATPENGHPRGQFNLWLNLQKYLGEPIIMAFNGATPALALAEQSDQEVITKALQTLEQAYPG